MAGQATEPDDWKTIEPEDWKTVGGDNAPTAPGSLIPEPVQRFGSNFAGALNPFPAIGEIANEATDPNIGLRKTVESHFFQPQADQFHQARQIMRGQGEGEDRSLPARLSMAGGHALAGAMPLIGPAAANAGEQIGHGDVAGGIGSGAGLITGSVGMPRLSGATGRGMSSVAEPIAENAAGLPYIDRAFGRNGESGGMTPGRFALDYTKGVRPGTVARQAQDSLLDINNRLEGVVGNSNADYHLQPPRDVVGGSINKASGRNSTITPVRLQPMMDYLAGKPTADFKGLTEYPAGAHTPVIQPQSPGNPYGGGRPQYGQSPMPVVAETQTPATGLGMKRQFNQDFVQNWNPNSETKGQLGVARQGVRSMADELHRSVPESRPLDVAASAGIPIAESAEMKALKAGPVQNALNRFGAHTGALTSAIVGGATHGLPGAVAGLAIPEFMANPTVQMTAARGLDLGGKVLRSPARYGSAPMPALRPKQPQQ